MTIIKIAPNENGSHDNQTCNILFAPPEGWAIVPEDMLPLENFPFGDVTTQDIDGVPTVTSWTPLPKPESEPAPELEPTMENIVKTMLGG